MRAIALLALGVLLGCATNPMVRPSADAQPGQDVVYKSGLVIVTSKGQHSEVLLEPVTGATGRYKLGERVGFIVAMRNLDGKRIEVSEASVEASANGVPAHVFRAAEIEDQIRREESWAQAFNIIGGALQAAGTSSEVAQIMIQDRTTRNASAIQASANVQLGQLSGALQRTTLEPGELVVGGVSIEAARRVVCPRLVQHHPGEGGGYKSGGACQWTIAVRVGQDRHLFAIGEALEEPE